MPSRTIKACGLGVVFQQPARTLHGTAHDDPQAHAEQTATDSAAASSAHARSRAPNRKMATVGRPRPLQLLRGPRKPQESGDVSGSGADALVAYSSPQEPETPDPVDPHPRIGSVLASSTEHASSLSGCTLCCHSSEIRTGCANKRSSGSVRGVSREWYPYRDQQLTTAAQGYGCPTHTTNVSLTSSYR